MPLMTNSNDLSHRAEKAYFRSGGRDQPSGSSSEPYWATNGRLYVPIFNGGRMLAVYRVLSDGTLKRLKRWPQEIDQKFVW